jgi:hypothetical protein
MRAADPHGETGSTSVLVLGLALVVFAISGLAVDGTRAFLYRRTLQSTADGAVLAAAGEIDTTIYYGSGGRSTRLSGTASEVASEYLSARGSQVDALLDVTTTRVTLQVRGSVPTTFLGLVGIDELPVAASATARPIRVRVGR